MRLALNRMILLAGALLALSACRPLPQVEQDPMVLKYDRPAAFFEEALPLGNGRLGACVYGGVATDRFSLNDITLWTGEPDRLGAHPDIAAGIGARAAATVPLVREALEAENYPRADSLQMRIQGHSSEIYQPLGSLTIRYDLPDSAVTAYRRTLDLDQAIARTEVRSGGMSRQTEAFLSAPDSVLVVRITADTPFSATLSLSCPLPTASVTAAGQTLSQEGYAAWHAYPDSYPDARGKWLYDPGRGIHFRTLLGAVSPDGSVHAAGESLRVEGATRLTLYLVNATSFNGFDKDPVREGKDYRTLSRSNLDRCLAKGAERILEDHLRDYTALFSRVRLHLGTTPPEILALPTDEQLRRYTDLGESNPALEALYYQYGRYLLIASSRTEGVPANLQGLWNERLYPPWGAKYTVNINLEENYWPAEAAALPEAHTPLLTFLERLSRTGADTAERYYDIGRGWACGHNSDIWAMSCPVGLEAGHPSWANWNMGGAWLSTDIWERYLYTQDRTELRRLYPVLQGAARFCMDWLVEKTDPLTGQTELLTSPSTSPENLYRMPDGYVGTTLYGATADLALVRECLQDAVAAGRELIRTGCLTGGKRMETEAFIQEAEAKLSRLRGYRIGSQGQLQEWYHDWEDLDPKHRHQSHLIGLYPGHQITPDGTPELAKAAAKTLEIKGMETTGWSAGWRVNLLARLRDGEGAYRMLRRLLRYVSPDDYAGPDARRGGGTYPNLLDAHSPFQIDGNFGGCAGIMEMLLQSEADGTLHLLPALPKAWSEGGVSGLRTRGGKTVSLTWKRGRVTASQVEPLTPDSHYEVPIRKGEPYWNGYAKKFTYAPAFGFSPVPGAATYRYEIRREGDILASFTADSPSKDLGRVWKQLAPGPCRLTVTALAPSGDSVGVAGTRSFIRDFPFRADTKGPAKSYRQTALDAIRYVHNMPSTRHWQQAETPDMSYPFNAYVCKIIGATARIECLVAREIPELREEALQAALGAGGYLARCAQGPGTPLEGWPPTYGMPPADEATHVARVSQENAAKMMVLEASVAGEAFLDLFDATADSLWLARSLAVARTYARLQAEDGSWPVRVNLATGESISHFRLWPAHLLKYLRRLEMQYGIRDFAGVRDRAEAYVNTVALPRFDLSGMFEDSMWDDFQPYSNLTNFTASPYAAYLLTNPSPSRADVRNAMDLIRLSEDQFVHWDVFEGVNAIPPYVCEQYFFEEPVDASIADVCDGYLSLYEYNGDKLALAKAEALLNALTRFQEPSGRILTLMKDYGGRAPGPEDFWLNSTWWTATQLLRLDGIRQAE